MKSIPFFEEKEDIRRRIMLKGKTAVITGCLKGIGYQTVETFASQGADIFACAQYHTEEYEVSLSELSKKYGVEIIPVYFDLLVDEQIKQAVMSIRKYKKPINILVNIAGYTKDSLFQMTRAEEIEKIMKINFVSQMVFSQYIVKLMINGKCGGSIVNISSISGIDGSVGQLSYSASKAALLAASKVMAEELAEQKIRVNTIAPGFIDTDMYHGVPEELLKKKIERTKLKRMGKAEEVSNAIAFLASDLASHITGQTIRIDGGKGII